MGCVPGGVAGCSGLGRGKGGSPLANWLQPLPGPDARILLLGAAQMAHHPREHRSEV